MADLRFNDNGTISLTLGAETITLRRATIGQMFHYQDRIAEISDAAREKVEKRAKELAELGDEEQWDEKAQKRADAIKAELGDPRRGFDWLVVPWLREVFEDLGSAPLPKDLNDAPAELADVRLPNQIIQFWRTVPLAHSPNGRR